MFGETASILSRTPNRVIRKALPLTSRTILRIRAESEVTIRVIGLAPAYFKQVDTGM
jgi:hypothetical protein